MTASQRFRSRLLISAEGGKGLQSFAAVLDPWQVRDFEALDEGWEMVAGLRDTAPFQRAYLERPRGHSKTTDIAVMVLFALWTSQVMLWGVAAADDQDQARLLRDAIKGLVVLNPWLQESIEIQNYRVRNKRTDSILEIISNDAGSSYGFTPHFVIVDELTHWKKRDLWDSLFSSSAKRDRCMLVIISNAGTGQGLSWQWELREACRASSAWYFSRIDGPQASWMSERALAEQRNILPANAYQRLWLNQWVRDTGEGLEWSDVEAALTLKGPQGYQSELLYIGCLDVGIRNDHSALVILGLDVANGRYKVANVVSWKPADYGGQINLADVERGCMEMHVAYKLRGFVYDAYQAVRLVEELSRQAAALHEMGKAPPLEIIEFKFNSENQLEMAEGLLSVFRNRLIDLYPEKDLLDDLMRVQIEEKTIGYKVTAKRDERGHADRAMALAMMLPVAIKTMRDLRQPAYEDGLGDSLI